jgi:hypothetical protein
LGDGLADDFDHRPRVEDGLRQVDAFAAGDPLKELVQAERVAAFWLLLQVPAELGRELGGQLVLEPPASRSASVSSVAPVARSASPRGAEPRPGLDLSDELVVLHRRDLLGDRAWVRCGRLGAMPLG